MESISPCRGHIPQAFINLEHPHSAVLLAAMVGMNVTLSFPEGMELDPALMTQCEEYAQASKGGFKIIHDFEEGFAGAHVLYPKAWCPVTLFKAPIGNDDVAGAQKIFDSNKSWKCTSETMNMAAKDAIYLHCLPCDRGHEVTNEVIDKTKGSGWTSAVFDQAENRLHIEKAVMSLVM